MALALYRKYRPRTFAELIGQEHVTEPLMQALRSGRLNHAYLFSGPRGCGKTSSARILARSLNCAQGPTPEPCGECESCRALGNDGPGSIDVIEIDAASHGGVDDARDLRERAFFTPATSRYKIYVIDEAHMVSSAGFNALLKLVEEPPEYVKFVFATTEPEKVLPTIRSRTHHYPFRLIPPGVLRPYLEQLCAAEGIQVEQAVFPLVVRAGGGSVRDSLSVLDQLIAGAGPDGVTYQRAVALLGVTDAALLDELCDALAAGDGAGMFATVDRVVEAGHDARRFAADLLERFRDLIVLRQVPDAGANGLLDVPEDQLARMSTQASQLGPATLSRCADIVHDGLVEMRGTASPRLLLELICARMLLPAVDGSAGGLLQRLERLEQRFGADAPAGAAPAASSGPPAGGPPVSAPPAGPAGDAGATPSGPATAAGGPTASTGPAVPPNSTPPQPPAGQPPGDTPAGPAGPTGTAGPTGSAPATGTGGPLDAAALRRMWDEIVATVGRRSKRAAAVVREASVRDVEGDTIVLWFQHAVHATMLDSAPQPLLDAAHQVLGGAWQVRCETGDGGAGRAEGRRGPAGAPAGGRAEAGSAGGSPPHRSGQADGAATTVPAARDGAGASPASDPADGQGTGDGPGTGGADWPEPVRPPAAEPPVAGETGDSGTSTGAGGPGAGPGGRATPDRGAGAGGPATVSGAPGGAGPADAAVPAARPAGQAPRSDRPDPPGRANRPDAPDESDEVDTIGDARTGAVTSEQRARQLLQQQLGAERVGETG